MNNKNKYIPRWKQRGFSSYKEYKDYLLNDLDPKYICSECKKEINMFLKEPKDYAYKIAHTYKKNGGTRQSTKYYCGYKCYKKAIEKRQKYENRVEKAELINKYNGVLNLKECEFCEDLKIIIEEEKGFCPSFPIKTRNDFKNFINKYYELAERLINHDI